ncbi:hypothetical protein [Halorarius halobius]|uniref:hypothetical protein n=1 Tax=Halorarius halobius TaxID=2962671 RepID=UPI0020CF81D3|nr:hypothetical protein [Halorarius halobius]
MYELETTLNGHTWVTSLSSYTNRVDDTLHVNLRGKYRLRPVGSQSVAIEGNLIPLSMIGVEVSAQKLASFWQYLDQHYESLFSYIVTTALAVQAKKYISNGMMGGVPAITAAVEVAGYMRYFVDQHPVPSGAHEKFEEILTEQLGNQHGAELLLSTGDFSSELWFAQNVFELRHAVEFSTDANRDLVMNGEDSIEVTRKRPSYDTTTITVNGQDVPQIDVGNTVVTLPQTLASALQHARYSIEYKKDRGASPPDIVAVDITGRTPGFELTAMANLFGHDFFALPRQLANASNLAAPGEPAILFYTSPYHPDRRIDAIALPHDPDTSVFPTLGHRSIRKRPLDESDLPLN